MTRRCAFFTALAVACASDPLELPAAAAGAPGDAGAGGEAGAAAAGGEAGAAGSAGEASCPISGEPSSIGALGTPAINEASGLAASRRPSGLLYAHNDSGSGAQGYALREDGSLVATLELIGALAQDWEDMGIGPGPESDASYLYFADIGDNTLARNGIVVHRALEPELDVDISDQSIEIDFSSLYFEYPDGAHDAETLFVDPQTADLYIVTKAASGSDVYVARAPHSATEISELELVTALSLPALSLATAGDMAADGGLIVIRTYGGVFGWLRAAGQSVGQALAGPPCELSAPLEPQGEAIALSPDAASYFTVSEGSGAELFRVDFE